jgi:hypothetical protein
VWCFSITPLPELQNSGDKKTITIEGNTENKLKDKVITTPQTNNIPTFKVWKGEDAQEMLTKFWEVSNGDKDFILTMLAENGSFNPYLKHPKQNRNKTWDYSFGLNDKYHKPFINKILNKEVSFKEIAEYHWKIYSGKKNTTSCGYTPFCGYNVRKKNANQIIFN